jgi:exodeoxyribonuclease VII large subunit
MINVTRRRFPAAKLYLYPSLVQGPSAPPQLINALKTLDESGICDVIIIGRGGGSAEDLWCFNDENLARAVFNCKTPIISAVGHETDFTICDFVADLRAPTPSAAAELAVPDVRELKKQFSNVQKRMHQHLIAKTGFLRQRLLTLSQRPVLQSPKSYFDDRRMALAREEERLFSAVGTRIERERMKLFAQSEKLKTLDPLSVLGRGFSVAFGSDGKAIKSVNDLPSGTEFELMLSDGKTQAVSK